MFTAASRSGLIVKEETPRSYFGPRAGRMPVNSAVWTWTFRPSAAPIALAMSTS
ncbi:hypothetical protein SRABI128_06216 [Microbacterium sp. Bi128]|nr:hypothetical protein SRABI128_06216 [Microbacterium sp. Bi128]